MQAVILAGGLGTRLRPLTHDIPKVLVPIAGRPFLHYVLDMLSDNEIRRIIVCVGYLGDQVVASAGNGEDFGCDLEYSFEEKLLDTAGAIKNAENLLDDEFLVLNGDTCHPIDYQGLIRFWRARADKHEGLIVLYENEEMIVPNNVRVDDAGEVIEYDKAGLEGNCYVDGGVQIFRKSVFRDLASHTPVSLEKDVYERIIGRKGLLAYVSPIRYYDIGTPDGIHVFEEYLKAKREA
jgi:NDP-sugar pyrophosphorylase family protein